MNIVVMAGGGGTRLWPLSRQRNPKQFLDLGSGQSLLQMAVARALAATAIEHVYIATVQEYQDRVQEQLPAVAQDHIFIEPHRRDTAPAFAAVAAQLAARGEGAVPTVFMWADHVFTKEEEFIHDLKRIPQLLEKHPQSIVVVGHVPTSPETGFGYIEAGEALPEESDVRKVKSFKEKPDLETATQYVASGTYYWNMGSISGTPDYLLQELRRWEPNLMNLVDTFTTAVQAGETEKAAAAYASTAPISIDYALLEKTPTILAVTGDYGWNDVGNWAAVKEVFGKSGDHVPAGHHVQVDSHDNYVYNATDKVVSLIGVHDTIVVVTDDALLITDKNSSAKVKDVVVALQENKEGKRFV